jgi:outer membrane protein OmpA-like peptidoglycan-associated protein
LEAAEARRKADEEAQRQAQQAAAREAAMQEEAWRQAELAEVREAQMRAEAAAKQAQIKADAEIAAAQAKAEADALRVREEVAKQEADRALRAAEELLDQFNHILETSDTVRGLVITMGDVLFDTGKYELRMNARELLAKISGIVLAHPEQADTVRNYLIGQALSREAVTARGLGKTVPVASNDNGCGAPEESPCRTRRFRRSHRLKIGK